MVGGVWSKRALRQDGLLCLIEWVKEVEIMEEGMGKVKRNSTKSGFPAFEAEIRG